MYKTIPQELIALDQWVGWKKVIDEEKDRIKKVPINPLDGNWAQSNNASTWGSFTAAVKAVDKFKLDGIGIMFANNIFGVDIDHCIEDDVIADFAAEIIEVVRSYTELSPSGTGIHILCRGTLPPGGRRKGAVEMYCNGRFFTVTGNQYGEAYPFDDCSERIKAMHSKYLGGDTNAPSASPAPTHSDTTVSMLVEDILERAFKSKNGQKFKDLYNGNWESYSFGDGSQSCADQAFCNLLAFWCRKDTALMDAIFQRSNLMRPKWTSRRGSSTYGAKTIASAITECKDVWTPPRQTRERRAPALPSPSPLKNDPPENLPLSTNADEPQNDNEVKPHYKYDDTGNAQRFRDENRGDIRYNHIDGHWIYWDSRRWNTDETGAIKRKADAMLARMEKELFNAPEEFYNAYKKHITKSRSHRGKESFILEAMHLDGIPIVPAELDRAGNAFNVKNCVISLKTGAVRDHERSYLISKLADVSHDQDAKCPNWLKFLDDITCSNDELKLYLQRMIGYCMTASTQEQCMFFLYGNGSNGKSTFVDTIATMMGEYASSCQPETVMLRDRNNAARSDLARLKGARLVVTSEPNDGCRLDEGIVKQMTGGTENKLTARFLYGKEFEFSPEFKIVMSTNYKPIIKGTDNGIWRRVRLIPFEAHITDIKKDKHLPSKLRREMSGILNWAIEGAVGWYKEGLPPCPLVDTAVHDYRIEMDRIQQFIDDCIITEAGSTLQAAKLYHVYKNWCTEQGDRFPISSPKFFGELKKRFQVKKTSAFNEYLSISFSSHGFALSLQSSKE